jgi:hypothetical protein
LYAPEEKIRPLFSEGADKLEIDNISAFFCQVYFKDLKHRREAKSTKKNLTRAE